MNPMMKSSVLCSVLLLMLLNAGNIECFGIGTSSTFLSHKANPRKLLELNAVLDYDYAGPNPKHEPRGKKGGGGNRNP